MVEKRVDSRTSPWIGEGVSKDRQFDSADLREFIEAQEAQDILAIMINVLSSIGSTEVL